jgi:hypothetical protein
MSSIPAVAFVTSVFLGLSAAVAQQATNNAAASASSALVNPPAFQGLMVDAKGKTVGRLFITTSFSNTDGTGISSSLSVVRQISGIWVLLGVADLGTGFALFDPTNLRFFYKSADCTGPAYLQVSGPLNTTNVVWEPASAYVTAIPPATAPTIYFAGSASFITVGSSRYVGAAGCLLGPVITNPMYLGLMQNIPLNSLGLTLPFSIK